MPSFWPRAGLARLQVRLASDNTLTGPEEINYPRPSRSLYSP
jgi:hypothetical protein